LATGLAARLVAGLATGLAAGLATGLAARRAAGRVRIGLDIEACEDDGLFHFVEGL
jgi:hypothetical protein